MHAIYSLYNKYSITSKNFCIKNFRHFMRDENLCELWYTFLIFIPCTVTTPLVSNKDAVLKLLTSASTHQESSIRVVAMTIFGALLQTHDALERSEVSSQKHCTAVQLLIVTIV